MIAVTGAVKAVTGAVIGAVKAVTRAVKAVTRAVTGAVTAVTRGRDPRAGRDRHRAAVTAAAGRPSLSRRAGPPARASTTPESLAHETLACATEGAGLAGPTRTTPR